MTAAAAAALGATAVLGWCGVAHAQAPDAQGWWTVTNTGLSAGGLSAPAPPDVPADGLLVEGGQDAASPTAYAGVVFDVPDGATATSLTLDVAPGTGTTPNATVRLCPLKKTQLQPDQGGPMSNAPEFSCDSDESAVPSPDGATYRFDVSSLASHGVLAVAILPSASTDRVVFAKPSAESLEVSRASGDSVGAGVTSGAGSNDGPGSAAAPVRVPLGGIAPEAVVVPNAPAHERGAARSTAASQFVPDFTRSAPEAARTAPVVFVLFAALAGVVVWTRVGDAAVRQAATAMAGSVPQLSEQEHEE